MVRPIGEDLAALRIVVREGFSRDLADMLLEDLSRAVTHFEATKLHVPTQPTTHGKRIRKC